MENLWRKQDIRTRSICGENRTGQKGEGGKATEGYTAGAARDLGVGWKVSPFITLPAKTETVLADIGVSGMIKHMWIVPLSKSGDIRNYILRLYYDGDGEPAVECPVGDFFASPMIEYHQINSLLVCRNPYSGFNCYFEIPFKSSCRVTMENLWEEDRGLAYQIDYEERAVPDDALYFHAQFRRENPLPYKKNYTILDTVRGKGCYIGASMLYGIPNNGWWGEGRSSSSSTGTASTRRSAGRGRRTISAAPTTST